MRVISTNEFRNNLASYLDEVDKNDVSLIISKFGKPLAKLVPVSEEEDFETYYGFLGEDGESGEEFVNRVRRNSRERRRVKDLRNGKGIYRY